MYYYIKSQYLTHEVNTHHWGQVPTANGLYYYIESQYLTHEVSTHSSTARGQYKYIEFKYLTHEVSTHHWGPISSARGQNYYFKSKYLSPSFYCKRLVLLPWVPVADTIMSVHITEAKFLLLEVSSTTLSPSIWHLKSVYITEAKFLLLKVSITTLCQNIWHMKSVQITETKVLLLEVSTSTLSPSIWHHGVSTHDWGKVSTAGGMFYYIESQYLITEVSTYS